MKEAENPHIMDTMKGLKKKRDRFVGGIRKRQHNFLKKTYLLIFQTTLLRNPKYKYNTFKQ